MIPPECFCPLRLRRIYANLPKDFRLDAWAYTFRQKPGLLQPGAAHSTRFHVTCGYMRGRCGFLEGSLRARTSKILRLRWCQPLKRLQYQENLHRLLLARRPPAHSFCPLLSCIRMSRMYMKRLMMSMYSLSCPSFPKAANAARLKAHASFSKPVWSHMSTCLNSWSPTCRPTP